MLNKIYRKNKMLFWGLLIFSSLMVLTYLMPLFFDKESNHLTNNALEPISPKHLMGTDSIGHDLWSFIIQGTRNSLKIAFCTALISGFVGTLLGIIAGYFRSCTDSIVNLICDFLVVFPDFVLAFIVIFMFGKGMNQLILSISICYLPLFIKNIRAVTIQVSQKDFVQNALSLGASHFYILRKHIFPHVLSTLITLMATRLGSIILVAASMGFIGLGLDPSTPEWGSILSFNKSYISSRPYLIFGPLIFILLTSLAFNLIGEGLVQSFSPRQSQQKEDK
ncbi:ABC transporter permease [Candidatus Phytoplasma pruni]|uniref:ABC transporter permease n=2 Tax=Candidatus Phytoplasma pruni TaxID=479893 RepID=A0A851HBW5_9MOLU|nr:ABC transporter permease [Candidatus Phytoplasma pruni]